MAVELRAGYVPAPYKADADETATCPDCGRMNDTDANYCDQCDAKMTATTDYMRHDDENVQCPECQEYNDSDAHFCDQCGVKLEGRTDVMTNDSEETSEPINNDDDTDLVDGSVDDTAPTVHGFENGVGPMFTSKAFKPSDVPRMGVRIGPDNHIGLRHVDARDGSPSATQLTGIFSRYNQWYEIASWWEGEFMEMVAPGAFSDTIENDRAAMRCLYDHGFDPQLGNKPIGPISDLRDTKTGPEYIVDFLRTDYNTGFVIPALEGELISGEKVGSQLGASMRFEVLEDQWNLKPKVSKTNPQALPERTILRAKVYEFGPVTFPANAGATAGARSISDQWISRMAHDSEYVRQFIDSFEDRRMGRKVAERIKRQIPADAPPVTVVDVARRQAALRRRAEAMLATSPIQ